MNIKASNPYISRVIGALGAGAGVLSFDIHNWKGALSTFIVFLLYGTTHSAATATAPRAEDDVVERRLP